VLHTIKGSLQAAFDSFLRNDSRETFPRPLRISVPDLTGA